MVLNECVFLMKSRTTKDEMTRSLYCTQTMTSILSCINLTRNIIAGLIDHYRNSKCDRSCLYYWKIRRARYLSLLVGIASLYIVIFYVIWPSYEVVLPYDVDPYEFQSFEPDVASDFPKDYSNKTKIPRIIHWTFKDTSIPPVFHTNIEALVKRNPGWTFYLWTDESSLKFIEDTHPELIEPFKSYKQSLCRIDFLRYVVLYEIGGFYLDMDVKNFRSLDRLTHKYTCIFPPEPFEHAVLRAHTYFLISNAIMICKPKHPFLKQILENLPRFAHMLQVLDATGPAFVTTQFMIYNQLGGEDATQETPERTSNSPFLYKGKFHEDHHDAVYIPNTQYFSDNIDSHAYAHFYWYCKDFDILNDLEKRACANLAKRGMHRPNSKYAFSEHKFYRSYDIFHLYNFLDVYLKIFSKDITELVPNIKIYKGRSFDIYS